LRYYDIRLTDPKTGTAVLPSSLAGLRQMGVQSITSLLPNSQYTNPAALDIELDITQYNNHAVDNKSFLRIWGLGLQDIGSAFNINGYGISVRGGMAKGYPLANPAQAGLLVTGQVFQAFGNWIGTDMTVDMFLAPLAGSPDAPVNLTLNWLAGQPLHVALKNTLQTAFPKNKIAIAINPNIIQAHTEPGVYGSLGEFAEVINDITSAQGGQGVCMATHGDGTILCWDGTQPAPVKQINFQDLIGQVTWIAPLTITAKLVMRGDLHIGDIINLPQAITTTTPQALTRFADKTTFTGNFIITQIQHWGRFRQPDAASWCTTIWCNPQPKAGTNSSVITQPLPSGAGLS